MGKGLAVAEIIGGIFLWLIGIGITVGMLAANTIMIVAAPMLIFSLLLFIVGSILFWRASLNLKEDKKPPRRTFYDADGKKRSAI